MHGFIYLGTLIGSKTHHPSFKIALPNCRDRLSFLVAMRRFKLNKQSSSTNQENTLHFESKIPLNTGNQMILEMSNANGDFTNAIVLKTQNSSQLKDSILHLETLRY